MKYFLLHLKISRTTVTAFFLSATLLLSSLSLQSVFADTKPASGTLPTVSADSLPTVQINGVVWDSVTVGNTVYATGEFTKARPAGSAAGQNEVTRTNILAFDITTGILNTSFNHSLDAAGRTITASPDGKRLYVGGKFLNVDGKSHPRLAAFDLTTNTLVSSFTAGTSSTVLALAATNSTVYAGGGFANASNGQSRNHVIAYSSTGALLSWNASTDRQVAAMVLTKDNSKLIIGGSFSTVNSSTFHGTAALSTSTGAPLSWASSSDTFPIRDDNASAGITSLSTDGINIYVTAFNYGSSKSFGGFEGRAALNPANGNIVWLNDCHGDSYDAIPLNNVLYSVSHAHDCQPAGAFPDPVPRTSLRALAESLTPSGTNGPATQGYNSFAGKPRSTQLVWYPNLDVGTYTGSSQAAWTVTGNESYVVLGGEFPKVNGVAQQGLTRFAVASKAPNKSGPVAYAAGTGVSNGPVGSDGRSTVTFPATWDRDNASLTYKVYRDGSATAVGSISASSRFWSMPTVAFKDSGLAVGSTHTYKVVVSDTYGNSTSVSSVAPTGCHIAKGAINTLCTGDTLTVNRSLYSNNGKYHLKLLENGNLVLYDAANTVIWQTKTGSQTNTFSRLILQTDGHLVLYNSYSQTTWYSSTYNDTATNFTIQDDGNLVVYSVSGTAIWNSGTNR